MSFELIPAIDLLGGQCVRLTQGRYEDATIYEENPGAQAARFVAHPIRRLHVVDLDGAKAGKPVNTDAIAAIVAAAGSVPVQVGGGIRTVASVEALLAAGVDRAILGTVALRDPALVREAAKQFPGRIVVGIDAKDGRVAVEGWTEGSDLEASDLARRFEDAGVAAIVHTDIARDGMLEGPNLEATAALAREISIPVIAVGRRGLEHRRSRRTRPPAKPTASPALIIGRALYEGHDRARPTPSRASREKP